MRPRHVAVGVALCGLAGLAYLAMQPLRRSAQTSGCETNLKQIGIAMLIYVRDYDEKMPGADNWSSALRPYVIGFNGQPPDPETYFRQRLQCPTTGSFYLYNRNIAGRSYVPVNAATNPWIYEVGAGQSQLNLSDAGQLWPAQSVHDAGVRRGNHVLFGDGHVQMSVAKPKFAKFAPPPKPIAPWQPRAQWWKKP